MSSNLPKTLTHVVFMLEYVAGTDPDIVSENLAGYSPYVDVLRDPVPAYPDYVVRVETHTLNTLGDLFEIERALRAITRGDR